MKTLCIISSIIFAFVLIVSNAKWGFSQINDNCSGAIQFPTLQNGTCVGVTSGESVSGATQSLFPNTCTVLLEVPLFQAWTLETAEYVITICDNIVSHSLFVS